MTDQSQVKTAIVLLILQSTLTNTAKNTDRPVHEVINEQARIDDKKPFLPYGNPLAANSNAKLHAHHQQAMFNAERVRQHRAQIQRWNQIPKPVDSYMKAYQESQENHQLALERMQSNLNKKPRQRQEAKSLQAKETEDIQIPEMNKITRADAVSLTENRIRNHRSYGSVYYNPENKGKISISPGPTYDRGVTIKPNGNIGLSKLEEGNSLFTEAVASKTQYVYPKYSQTHGYQTVEDIQALNYILSKPVTQQLSEFNALVHTSKPEKDILEEPIDLYFYLKDPSLVKGKYNQLYSAPYATHYAPDYGKEKPITEEVDDIEDPNKTNKFLPYGVQPVLTPSTNIETATLKENYYQLEVGQTVTENQPKDIQYSTQYAIVEDKPNSHYVILQDKPSSQYSINQDKPEYELVQEKPKYEALKNEEHLAYPLKTQETKYVHQSTGVKHLSHDGTGTSAYGDDEIHYAANYEFGYRVKDHHTGNDFGHQEQKTGDKTRGSYHVLLPDGRMQQVTYSAGPSGCACVDYIADVPAGPGTTVPIPE